MTVFIAYMAGAGFVPTLLGVFGDRDAFGLAFILIGCVTLLSVLLLFHLNIPEEQQGEGTEGGTH